MSVLNSVGVFFLALDISLGLATDIAKRGKCRLNLKTQISYFKLMFAVRYKLGFV